MTLFRMLPALALVALPMAAPEPAEAGFYSGNDLYDTCTVDRSDSGYIEKTYECVAYIAGAVDAFNTTREANNLKSCIPPRVTVARLKEVTVDYLRANPDGRDVSASALVFSATRKAWPCPTVKTPKAKSSKSRKK